ncbi:unnamed protein product [Hydatigera taeniaeformis]|uniref:Curli production assembly/transport component CsgG n=1 Tax=Hydatigena taeniaeformis TaxID=6205 RepID=A0A0R3WS46_HYDTA|nr:unnamed protein product [Hydatigera taeniaeformis]
MTGRVEMKYTAMVDWCWKASAYIFIYVVGVATGKGSHNDVRWSNQNQGGGYIRQRPNGQGGGGYQGDDSTALATLNILSNPSVVAAIVNAAKNEGMTNGQGGSRGT